MLAIDITKVPSQPAGSRRLIGAAILRSRVYSALATDIVDLADVEAVWLPKTTADQLPLDLRSLCHAAVAEAYMTCGLVRQATHQARLACDYANEADNDACRYRALSLLACNLALNGEFARAEEASLGCGELDVKGRWPQSTAALPVLLAEMMTAYARLDVEPLVALLERFARVPRQGPIWIAVGKLATGWLCMLRQDYDGALLAATGVSGGADAALIPRLITGFATGLQAMALVHRGEAARAITLLEGVESLGDHALCFDLQRATAYLHLGENREALICTDGCLRLGVAHNLRTLSSILLRRAIANQRLGYVEAADNTFSEAFRIMAEAGAMTPLLGLAQEELEALLHRLVDRQPDMSSLVAQVLGGAETRPRNEALAFLPTLTRREVVVAGRLRSNEPIADIATALFVSTNTLKSQVRSLYVKLGVSSRDEAVALLERGGFYDRTHPDPAPH